MMSIMYGHACAAVLGILSHVLFFNRGEHHLNGPIYSVVLLSMLIATFTPPLSRDDIIAQALVYVQHYSISYLLGLYSSLLVYRVLLSPLRRFSGPWGAKISDLWLTSHTMNHDAYKVSLKLHEQYGDFVRIGPASLSIAHPEAATEIYGRTSKCTKGAWYDLTHPMVSMLTSRDRTIHDKRRGVWSSAFSDANLRVYEPRVAFHQKKLVSAITDRMKDDVEVSELLNLYNFDIMCDLGFGTASDTLNSLHERRAISLLGGAMEPLGNLFPAWVFRTLISIPGLSGDWWRFIDYCVQKLNQRMTQAHGETDIMSALLNPYGGKKVPEVDLPMLRGDAQLIIVAGSDTTSTSLVHTLYELALHPKDVEKIRQELLDAGVDCAANVQDQRLKHLKHLNGVINEALRLHSPIPTLLQRITPPGGMMIGDTFVPGQTTVWCPQYVVGRSEKAYVRPSSFEPERWYSQPELIKEKHAYAPFSMGPYGCIGRPLALMNLRTTIAVLLTTFDFKLASPEVSDYFLRESKDEFTLKPADLHMVFAYRGDNEDIKIQSGALEK